MDFQDHQDIVVVVNKDFPFRMDSFRDAFEEDNHPSEKDAWAFLVASSFHHRGHHTFLDALAAFHRENHLVEEDIHREDPFLDTSVAAVVDAWEIRKVVVVGLPYTYSTDYFEKEEKDDVESYYLECCKCRSIFDHFHD
jgi:hypothetical protein